MTALLQALMTKFAGSTINTDVGGRIYFGNAPAEAEYPHIVFFNIGDAQELTFSSRYENYHLQFSIFDTSEDIVNGIGKLYTDLIALLDECSLTITSKTFIWMHRLGSPQTMIEEITTAEGTNKCHHWAVEYEVTVQE